MSGLEKMAALSEAVDAVEMRERLQSPELWRRLEQYRAAARQVCDWRDIFFGRYWVVCCTCWLLACTVCNVLQWGRILSVAGLFSYYWFLEVMCLLILPVSTIYYARNRCVGALELRNLNGQRKHSWVDNEITLLAGRYVLFFPNNGQRCGSGWAAARCPCLSSALRGGAALAVRCGGLCPSANEQGRDQTQADELCARVGLWICRRP